MRTVIFLRVLSVTAQAQAQTSRSPDNFGSDDESISVVGSRTFDRLDDPRRNGGGIWRTAPLDFLPNGSRITRITYYFHDTDPVEDLVFSFCYSRLEANTGEGLGGDCEPGGSSAGVDGDSYVVDSTGYDIRYRQDQDGDGDDELYDYYLRAIASSPDSDPSVRAVEILWRRQVSPAPQSATFNDVPPSDGAFQFVEALVSSGITVGCGEGNYCPDAPVTRRQMAVFLAKALGLHWPWNAP